jgi:hypothetical protein
VSSTPIADRFALLYAQWRAFTMRADARLLIWRAADEERPMIDAFVAMEGEAESAQTPDIFVQLSAPFRDQPGHGYRVATELCALYEQAAQLTELPARALEALRAPAAEASTAWRCPSTRQSLDDVHALLNVLSSLRKHVVGAVEPCTLAVWLSPDEVGSWDGYLRWLQRLVQQTPTHVRFLVVDDHAAPQHAPLAKLDRLRVLETPCDLTVLAAVEELAAAQDDTPGGALRKLQTECAARLAADDLEAAARAGSCASKLAQAQGWPHLAAVTSMMLGSAYGARQPHAALAAYAEAERLGAEREAQESASPREPAYGARIRLQAQLGMGAVLLACRAYAHAATAYQKSAALAQQLRDAATELDAHRLGSFCHAALGHAEAAWELGSRGLQIGVAMDAQTRGSSTLPYLAEQLLRLTQRHDAYDAHRKPLERRLAELLGVGWRARLLEAS